MVRRNNQDRLSTPGPAPHDSPAAAMEVEEAIKSGNKQSLLSFVMPTEFVELPSRGMFYPSEHPLFNKDVVEIRFMTAKHEDIITAGKTELIFMNREDDPWKNKRV